MKVCIEIPVGPDQGLPGGFQRPIDPGYGIDQGGRPDQGFNPNYPDNSLPPVPGQGLPPYVDNGLPGIDYPVDPNYGVEEGASPGTGLPEVPDADRGFTLRERRRIHALAQAKFVNTNMSPLRCYIAAAKFVLISRPKRHWGGGRPDNSLPEQGGGRPDQGFNPDSPGNALPKPPGGGRPDNSLPATPGGRPDNSLPGQGGERPDNALPTPPKQPKQ